MGRQRLRRRYLFAFRLGIGMTSYESSRRRHGLTTRSSRRYEWARLAPDQRLVPAVQAGMALPFVFLVPRRPVFAPVQRRFAEHQAAERLLVFQGVARAAEIVNDLRIARRGIAADDERRRRYVPRRR